MAKIKLTKTAVDAATPKDRDYELRDTIAPGFMLKVTPFGSKIFMLAYVNSSGIRRKPALGRFGELTVYQARKLAQDWLAEVRHGRGPCAEKSAARAAPTMKELCSKFIEEHSKQRNKPSTVATNEMNIKNHILPRLGRFKAHEVTRAHISELMTGLAGRPAMPIERSRACGRCSTSPSCGGIARTAPIRAGTFRNSPRTDPSGSSRTMSCGSSSPISTVRTGKDWSIPSSPWRSDLSSSSRPIGPRCSCSNGHGSIWNAGASPGRTAGQEG